MGRSPVLLSIAFTMGRAWLLSEGWLVTSAATITWSFRGRIHRCLAVIGLEELLAPRGRHDPGVGVGEVALRLLLQDSGVLLPLSSGLLSLRFGLLLQGGLGLIEKEENDGDDDEGVKLKDIPEEIQAVFQGVVDCLEV